MSIYQRIGEAIASQGKVTLVAALTSAEEEILKNSGFKKAGTMDLNGSNIDLYEVKVTQIINTQTPPYTGIRTPIGDSKPYKYEASWPENYRLYTNGTGNAPSSLHYGGQTTSLMDAAYNPLSILEDYYFTTPSDTNSIKIDLGALDADKALEYSKKIKEAFTTSSKEYTPKVYTNDSWTSYNQGYTGNRDYRNW